MTCKLLRVTALAFLLTGCDASGDRSSTVPALTSVVDSAGVQIVRVDADPLTLDEWTLGPTPRMRLTGAEAGESAAFSPVGDVRWLASGNLVVSDLGANRLLVFDSTGAYQRALGRVGDGPGEFRRMGALSGVSGDTVAVFDQTHRRLSYWDVKSGYLESVSVSEGASLEAWPADAWAWCDSMVVVLQLAITSRDSLPRDVAFAKWPMRAHLTLRDRTGAVVAASPFFAGTYSILDEGGDRRAPFSNNPFAAVGRDRVYFGSGETFTLSTLGAQFDSAGEIQWPALQEPVTPEEVAELRARRTAMLASLVPPERIERALSEEFAPALIPEVRPSVGRVLVDAEDRVWVERFEPVLSGPLAQKPGTMWHVLASDGRPVARLRLPERTSLRAVRGDEVVVMQRDGDDVETVAVYRIVRP